MSVEDKQLQTRSTWRQHRFVSGWSCYKVPSRFFFLFFFKEPVEGDGAYCLSGMFLWLWIELTCGLAPIFQYHFSLLESGYGSDVTWLNSNPIWLFFAVVLSETKRHRVQSCTWDESTFRIPEMVTRLVPYCFRQRRDFCPSLSLVRLYLVRAGCIILG